MCCEWLRWGVFTYHVVAVWCILSVGCSRGSTRCDPLHGHRPWRNILCEGPGGEPGTHSPDQCRNPHTGSPRCQTAGAVADNLLRRSPHPPVAHVTKLQALHKDINIFTLYGGIFFAFPLLTLHQRTKMPPGLSCSSSIWTGGWEETEPWRDTRSLSSASRESSSWAETQGTSTNAGTSGRLENIQSQLEKMSTKWINANCLYKIQ